VLINSKLFYTSTFRMAAIYLAVFVLSVAAVLAYVYWNTIVLLKQQTDDTIRAEVIGFSEQYQSLGPTGVAETISRRSQAYEAGFYLLVDKDGKKVAGNIASLPKEASDEETGWIDFRMSILEDGKAITHASRGYHALLPSGYRILVGREIDELNDFEQLIRRTLSIAVPIALALGLGGGLLTSRNFLRRVDAITNASQDIMKGDLASRMPISGTNDELDRLSHSLNQMLEQIERLMTGMKEVTSNVAHDLKTPLTRLRARVEAALRSRDPVQYQAALMQSLEESENLLQTFNALMSIARAEAGNVRDGFEALNLSETLKDVTELYEPIVEDAGGTMKIDIANDLPVKADRQLMSQAVSNLIDNAIKYGEHSGLAVEVLAKPNGTTIEVTVSDRGAGIPANQRERVKERFIRLDSSRSKPGNGLGLPLVASIMKLHGGDLKFEDNQPGLKARLILPRLTT
jgi:signal transduction histidine kinase